jgi:hypothetical protein
MSFTSCGQEPNMTVEELIVELSKYPKELEVRIYDHDNCCSFQPQITLAKEYTEYKTWNTVYRQHVELSVGRA